MTSFSTGTKVLTYLPAFLTVLWSSTGLYPIVGWKIGGETVYLAEGNAAGCGTAMEWAHKMGAYYTVVLLIYVL